jgi:hypothetical protein
MIVLKADGWKLKATDLFTALTAPSSVDGASPERGCQVRGDAGDAPETVTPAQRANVCDGSGIQKPDRRHAG